MTEDALGKFRKVVTARTAAAPVEAKPKAPAPAPPVLVKTDTKPEYVAFSLLENGNKYLSLALVGGQMRRRNYNAVREIVDDGELGTYIAIDFHFGPVIFIQGRNLKNMITGLLFDKVEVVREYDPKRWGEPEKDATVVTKIEIVARNTIEEKDEIEQRIEAIRAGV